MKLQTPCELLGFKKGDKFILDIGTPIFPKGTSVYLYKDDGTRTPYFTDDSDLDIDTYSSVDCVDLLHITKTNSADIINTKLRTKLSNKDNIVVSSEQEKLINASLGLEEVSLNLRKEVIEKFKAKAYDDKVNHIYLMRKALAEYVGVDIDE